MNTLNTGLRALPVMLLTAAALSAAPRAFTTFSPGEATIVISRNGADHLRFGTAAWGPNWAWTGIEGQVRSEGGAAVGTLTAKIGGSALRLGFRAARTAPNQIELDYELQTQKDTDLTLFVVELLPGKGFDGREVAIVSAGDSRSARAPFGIGNLGDDVSQLRLKDAAGGQTTVRFEPPCLVTTDGAARIVLAKDCLTAEAPRRLKIRVELPSPTDWYASAEEVPDERGIEAWYPWRAAGRLTDSAFSMADWLEKPAGKHGRIQRAGSCLIYHGQPIRLWGLNLCYGTCAPEKELADKRAGFYPHYGVNTVRLHKFADGTGWSGIQSKESAAEYDAAGLERMDYQVAKFREAGIYVLLSAHFGTLKLGPADRRDVPFLDEFGTFGDRTARVTPPHSAFFYSPELQNVHIRQIVNLLRHRNPHTGLTYAEETAICAVEIINEQSVMFFTSMAPLKQSATLRRQVGERFSDRLKKKYGSHDGLVKAWSAKALDGFEKDGFSAGEHLDRRNVLPLGNPWYWDPQQLDGTQAFRKRRLLDTLEFLYGLQCEAYDRCVAALRQAGFAGEIIGSNWQAGRAYSHFANLHSDARVGLIDRHNYFGGGGKGKFQAGSMLARPGSGSLSSGLQQVADRPFMLSEWIHVFPNEWGVEGPAIIGAYGLGLQGWDASYLFQNGDNAAFSSQLGRQAWDAMAPQILGVFPAVSRQVLRGDVRESDALAPRHVHVPSLFEGKLGFEDQVVQGYDTKELDSSQVPARALAAVRCTVAFTDAWKETPVADLAPSLRDDFIASSTGQLRWKEGNGPTGGFFTAHTEATRAVVGFADGQVCDLGGVIIAPQSRFAAIYLTPIDRDGTISSAKELLLVALARARNTGMKFTPAGDELLERGQGPVLLEPVKANLRLGGRQIRSVELLDHDGCRTGKTLPVTGHSFTIDGAVDQTPYYLIRCEGTAAR